MTVVTAQGKHVVTNTEQIETVPASTSAEPKATQTVRVNKKGAKVAPKRGKPGGATAKELMKATDWQPHSVRGFLSGTIRKKDGSGSRFPPRA